MSKLLKNDIVAWLDRNKVKNYILIPDTEYGFVVDVDGDLNLSYRVLEKIEVHFNSVSGNFDCSHNQLTSLEGSPRFVGKEFDCAVNKLESLDYLPISAIYFYCSDNSQLGEYQEMTNFLQIRDKVKSDKEKILLSASLKNTHIDSKVLKL